jgi:hypothetical protein
MKIANNGGGSKASSMTGRGSLMDNGKNLAKRVASIIKKDLQLTRNRAGYGLPSEVMVVKSNDESIELKLGILAYKHNGTSKSWWLAYLLTSGPCD